MGRMTMMLRRRVKPGGHLQVGMERCVVRSCLPGMVVVEHKGGWTEAFTWSELLREDGVSFGAKT